MADRLFSGKPGVFLRANTAETADAERAGDEGGDYSAMIIQPDSLLSSQETASQCLNSHGQLIQHQAASAQPQPPP